MNWRFSDSWETPQPRLCTKHLRSEILPVREWSEPKIAMRSLLAYSASTCTVCKRDQNFGGTSKNKTGIAVSRVRGETLPSLSLHSHSRFLRVWGGAFRTPSFWNFKKCAPMRLLQRRSAPVVFPVSWLVLCEIPLCYLNCQQPEMGECSL